MNKAYDNPFFVQLDAHTQNRMLLAVEDGHEWLRVIQLDKDKVADRLKTERTIAYHGLWCMFLVLSTIIVTSIVVEEKVTILDGVLFIFVNMISRTMRKVPRP